MTRIVVTNDDGFDSPGIAALQSAAQNVGDVYVVAPRHNHSGASHAITLRSNVRVERTHGKVFVVDGTPTDCARMAYSGWLGFEPDWIISGMNKGANLSDDVLYSGTVAAAVEGRFLKHTPVAFSLASSPPYDFASAREVCVTVLRTVLESPLPTGIVLNVNIPDPAKGPSKGFRLTQLADRIGVTRPPQLRLRTH